MRVRPVGSVPQNMFALIKRVSLRNLIEPFSYERIPLGLHSLYLVSQSVRMF